jgi:hypothetical protein
VYPPGYRLRTEEDALDADVFSRLFLGARDNPGADPRETVAVLRQALGLWRGPVFGGDLPGPICRAAAARYTEHRAAAWEHLFDTELDLGRHCHVVAELTALVEAEPLNERLCAHLMTALYRSDRQRDALVVYQRLHHRLAEETGLEPSPALQRRHLAILRRTPDPLVRHSLPA